MKLLEGHKRRIAATLTLRKGISLARVLKEIESAMQRFWTEAYDGGSWYIEVVEGELVATTRRHTSRGRPPKQALRNYLTALARTYKSATGQRLGRNIVTDSEGAKQERRTGRNRKQQHREKIHPFVLACVKAIGLPTGPKYNYGYPAGLVKDVFRGLNPDVKRGRPRVHPQKREAPKNTRPPQ